MRGGGGSVGAGALVQRALSPRDLHGSLTASWPLFLHGGRGRGRRMTRCKCHCHNLLTARLPVSPSFSLRPWHSLDSNTRLAWLVTREVTGAVVQEHGVSCCR